MTWFENLFRFNIFSSNSVQGAPMSPESRPQQQNVAALAAVLDAEQSGTDAMAIDGSTDDPELKVQQAQASAAHAVQRLRVAQEQIAEYATQCAEDLGSLATLAKQLDAVCGSSSSSEIAAAVQTLNQKLRDAALAAQSFAGVSMHTRMACALQVSLWSTPCGWGHASAHVRNTDSQGAHAHAACAPGTHACQHTRHCFACCFHPPFAEQQKQDAENFNKRSSQQAGMAAQPSDESKRPRESASGGPEEADGEDMVRGMGLLYCRCYPKCLLLKHHLLRGLGWSPCLLAFLFALRQRRGRVVNSFNCSCSALASMSQKQQWPHAVNLLPAGRSICIRATGSRHSRHREGAARGQLPRTCALHPHAVST